MRNQTAPEAERKSVGDTLTPLAVIKTGEGFLILIGNLLLIIIILSQKKLRRKEFLTLMGLAIGDAIYGAGVFSANIRRTELGMLGKHLSLVVPWECMKELHNIFFYTGEAAGAIMLVVVSLDRLLAVRWFSLYHSLGKRYAMVILGSVYGYTVVSLPVAMLLSRYAGSQDRSVKAMCYSTDTGPEWFSKGSFENYVRSWNIIYPSFLSKKESYLPNLHFWSGVVSIVIFVFTAYFFKRNISQNTNNENIKKQNRFTKTIGITVLFTFFLAVLPQGFIILISKFKPEISYLINPYAWLVSNLNNLANVFILGALNSEIRAVLNRWLRAPIRCIKGFPINYLKLALLTWITRLARKSPGGNF